MSFAAFMVTAALEILSPGPRMLACTFPAADAGQDPIRIEVEALPSLKDKIDRFRIAMHLDGAQTYRGLAQPIDRTAERDVLIRARATGRLFYTIGLRDDGLAALNLLNVEREREPERRETRAGRCRDYKGFLDSWLAR